MRQRPTSSRDSRVRGIQNWVDRSGFMNEVTFELVHTCVTVNWREENECKHVDSQALGDEQRCSRDQTYTEHGGEPMLKDSDEMRRLNRAYLSRRSFL